MLEGQSDRRGQMVPKRQSEDVPTSAARSGYQIVERYEMGAPAAGFGVGGNPDSAQDVRDPVSLRPSA